MAQTKKERLKRIVNKEFTDVLNEVARNEAYFDKISYERVINTLIKEWSTQGSAWNDVKADLMSPYGPGGAQGENPLLAPPEEVVGRPRPMAPDIGPALESGLDPSLLPELTRIAENAPPEFKKNINNVGNEVFNELRKEIGGYKTSVQLSKLVLEIVKTVVNAMGAAGGKKWSNPLTGGEEVVAQTNAPSEEEIAMAAQGAPTGVLRENLNKTNIIVKVQRRILKR